MPSSAFTVSQRAGRKQAQLLFLPMLPVYAAR
jgi:hypothetical protein